MRTVTTMELKNMEIINVCDGSRLGYAGELEFDRDCATVTALIVHKSTGFCGLGKGEDLYIPWCRIECFGQDAVLVRMTVEQTEKCCCSDKKNWFFCG